MGPSESQSLRHMAPRRYRPVARLASGAGRPGAVYG